MDFSSIARERVRDFFNNNSEYTLLSRIEDILKMRSRILIRHETCGTEFSPTIDRFLKKGTRCPNRECKRQRIKQSHKDRHGFEVVFKDKRFLEERSRKEKLKKYNSLLSCEGYKPLFPQEEYTGVILGDEHLCYWFECRKCGHKFEAYLSCGRQPICRKCFPISNGKSFEEKEVADFITKELGFEVEMNIRCLLSSKKEIDIFIKSKKVGIEYNGLFWHSEKYKEKTHLLEKTNECKCSSIRLIHVFSDEWLDPTKKKIVKSVISHALGNTKNKIGARQCLAIEDYDRERVKDFLNRNHISGNTNYIKSFSLIKDGEVFSSLTLRKPFTKKKQNTIEIARFCNKINYNVRGSFSKLMKMAEKYCRENKIEEILTYSDNRFGEGNVYRNYGFEYQGETRLGYYYTDGVSRFNRFRFRAKNNKSEKQIAEENKVYKIYDCGNKIFTLKVEG
jgi:hypothetical protein